MLFLHSSALFLLFLLGKKFRNPLIYEEICVIMSIKIKSL